MLQFNKMVDSVANLPFYQIFTDNGFSSPEMYAQFGQEVNIHSIFNAYNNPNKAYIYSIAPTSSHVFTYPYINGRNYVMSEDIGGARKVTEIVSGTFTWTTNSTKRYVIVNDSAVNVVAHTHNKMTWCYYSKRITSVTAFLTISGPYAYDLKYIHCEDIYFLTSIGVSSFQSNSALTSALTIPPNVTSLGEQAFLGTQITSVNINAKLQTIGQFCFFNCPITSFNVDALNPYWSTSVDNKVLFNYLKTLLFQSVYEGSYTIPNTVTTLYQGAFGNSKVTDVTFPIGVTIIQFYTFDGSLLTTFNPPATVTRMAYGVRNCLNLTTITLLSTMIEITLLRIFFTGSINVTELNFAAGFNPTISDGIWDISFSAKLTAFSLKTSLENIGTGTKTIYLSSLGVLGTDGLNNKQRLINSFTDFATYQTWETARLAEGKTLIGGYTKNSVAILATDTVIQCTNATLKVNSFRSTGSIKIGTTNYVYSSVDYTNQTITLAAPIGTAYAVNTVISEV